MAWPFDSLMEHFYLFLQLSARGEGRFFPRDLLDVFCLRRCRCLLFEGSVRFWGESQSNLPQLCRIFFPLFPWSSSFFFFFPLNVPVYKNRLPLFYAFRSFFPSFNGSPSYSPSCSIPPSGTCTFCLPAIFFPQSLCADNIPFRRTFERIATLTSLG